jgi:purine-binding chemotaxis protein CheW
MPLPAPAEFARRPAAAVDPAGATAAPACQLLRFTLGRASYAVDIGDVQEIQQVGGMTAVPMLPPFVRGVMNLRGSVVPVIDLAARLGLGSTRIAPRTCVVVVELGHRQARTPDSAATPHDAPAARQDGAGGRVQRLGMLVDAVHEVLDVAAHELEAVPALGTRLHGDFIRAMARVRGQIVEVLDLDRALDEHQLGELIGLHMRTRAQERAWAHGPDTPAARPPATALALAA